MSQENVEGLRRGLDAFNRRDRATFVAVCDPAVENVPPRDWPESEPIQGPEAVWDFYVEGNEPWDESPFEYGEIIDAGNDKIAAEMRREVRGKASGAGAPWSFWQVATFRDGKLLRSEWFVERGEALEAVGLSE
jgi:ketosteroid isomerase-like protein